MAVKTKLEISTRDHLLLAWTQAIHLTENLQAYYKETPEHEQAARVLAHCAESVSQCASELLEQLHRQA